MTTKAPKPPITAAKFLSMSGTEGYELVDGRIKEKAMGGVASWTQTRLAYRVGAFIETGRLGHVFGADCMYQCFAHKPEQVRKPDMSFVRSGRFPGEAPPTGPILIAPDLIAEVVSPKERVYELEDKIDDFRRTGVPLMWVINPQKRRIQVYRDGKVAEELTADDELTGDPVLPGFRVRVSDLFPPTPPPAS